MSAAQAIIRHGPDQLLQEAITQRRFAVLTLSSTKGWRTIKCKFVSGSKGEQTLHAEIAAPDEQVGATYLKPGTELGVTFRVGHKRCMFGAVLVSLETAGSGLTAVLKWPDRIQHVRRRVFERVQVPGGNVVAVRFWQEDEPGDTDSVRIVRHGQLEDLSAGGMRVRVANPDDVELGAVYRCAFAPKAGKPSLLIDARMRHREAVEHGRASIGFQFIGLEVTTEGRRTFERLARVVSQFHRSRTRCKPRGER